MSLQAIHTDSGVLAYDQRIEAPPELVWRYWTEPELIVRWMGKVATLDPKPGGIFRLDYGNGDVAAGTYLEVEPPARLVFTWGWEKPDDPVQPGGSRVQVDLDVADDGAATLLHLRHDGLPPESESGHDEGWQYFLGRLESAVAAELSH